MKKAPFLIRIILSFAAFCCLPVQAEVTLDNNTDLLGTWALAGTAKDLDGEKRHSEQTWVFAKDGTLATSGYDKRLPGGNFSVSTQYEVKNGKIVADVVGRPGKITTYTVIEIDDDSMIIKQGIGQYMFFSKK